MVSGSSRKTHKARIAMEKDVSLLRNVNKNYQPESIYDAAAGGLSLRYGFDEVGNLTLLRQADKNKKLAQYRYDGLNRLTQVMDGPTGTLIETYVMTQRFLHRSGC